MDCRRTCAVYLPAAITTTAAIVTSMFSVPLILWANHHRHTLSLI